MRKITSIFILAIFFGQSLLTSYMYAAEPAAKAEQTAVQNTYQQLVDRFLRMDLGSVDALWLIQMAAYLYVYEKNGIAWFDFERGQDSPTMMTINYFLTTYAPNIGFLANDEWADENYFKDKSIAWQAAYPTEYAKVYDYVKTVQSKYTAPTVPAMPTAPVPAPAPRPTPGVAPAPAMPAAPAAAPRPTDPTKFGEQCDVMYSRLMDEYYALIAIKDIPYAKIADVKQRISDVQSGKSCTVAAAVAVTQQDIQKENQAVVAQVRKDLNFGSANMKVIPDNIVPAYCEDTSANTLRTQLSDVDGQTIRNMKLDLDVMLQSQDFADSSIKRNVVNFVSQELTLADSVQSKQQWDASSVFHNMAQWLVLVWDSIINTRWIYQMIDLAKVNIDKFGEIGRFIDKEFDGIQSLKTKWNANYNWDNSIGSFTRTENTDGVIRFALPASQDAATNNATLTLATAKTKSIKVSEQPYTWTEYKWDISLEQFVQEAKNHWSIAGNQIDAATLGTLLTKEIISYAPDYYTYNDPNQPVVFFAEANGGQKVFKDHKLTQLMPEGIFSNTRGTTYVIGKQGDLLSMYYYEQAPESIKAKLEVDGKIVAWIDAAIAYDEQAIRDGYGSSFPLKIKARVYIADYLMTLTAARSLDKSTWSTSVDLEIQWPSICQFSLAAKMRYEHDGKQWYPSIEDSATNINELSARLLYNSNRIQVDVADVPWFVSSAADAVAASVDGDVFSAIMDPIHQYVSAAYYFDENKIADIIPDADSMVVVEYTNNGQRESIMDVAWSYAHLLRIDNVMQFVEQYMGGEEKEYSDEKSMEARPDQKNTDNYQLNIGNYYQDDQYLYVSYNYGDMDGNTNEIYPDKLGVEAMTASGPVSYQFELFDTYTYRAPVVHLFSDPSVYAAYVYAAYKGSDNTNYIIGSSDAYHGYGWNGYEPSNEDKNYASGYTMQWQSTSYPDVQTQEIVLSLYDGDMFVQYIEPTVMLYITYGSDCRNNATSCSQSNIAIYPTYLDGVPTYIIDTMQIEDGAVYEASISMIYTDPAWYEHNQSYGLKKPIQ